MSRHDVAACREDECEGEKELVHCDWDLICYYMWID